MLSISKITNADYYLGGSGGACCARPKTTRADYELAGEGQGEPPGRWAWRGENALGLVGEIRAEGPSGDAFRSLVNHLVDPRTGKPLGVKPQTFKTVEERVAVYRKRHPHATEEQVDAFEKSAMADQRQANNAWDLVWSPPKSWSVLHAALEWAGRKDEAQALWAALEVGVDAAMSVLHEELAFTESKPSGPEVGGQRTARYARVTNLQFALWRHHTSRDGDPQCHVHATLINRALDQQGRWRALYARAYLKSKHRLDAVFLRTAEAEAARALGLMFSATADGGSREIVGVSPESREFFSSRSRAVSEEAQQLIDAYTAAKGHPPSQRTRWRMNQQATLATRRAKAKNPPSRQERLEQWERDITAQTHDSLADILAGVDDARAEPGEPIEVPRLDVEAVIGQALADLSQRKSAWNKSLLIDALNRRLPSMLAVEPGDVARLLHDLAEQAIASAEVVSVEAKPAVATPASLTDTQSGRSVFEAPDGRRFTTRATLQREDSLLARLDQLGAPQVPTARAAELVAGSGLSEEQQAPVVDALASGRWLEVVDAPAGTGKSTMTRGLSQACEQQWGVGVTGLAIAENAAQVLRRQGLSRAFNIAAFLDFTDREKRGEVSDAERATFAVAVGSYVVVDEASTVDTPRLTQLLAALEDAGAGKVLLVGDRQQADPVDAGGGFALLVDELEHRRREHERAAQRERLALPPSQAVEQDAAMAQWTRPVGEREPAPVHRLSTVRRFTNGWERDASTGLRAGDVTVLRQYESRGRVHGHAERGKALEQAADASVTDLLQDRDSIVVTATTDEAAAAASLVRQRLVEAGRVEANGARLRPDVGAVAGVGDVVQTRLNDKTVGALNRQRWQVVGRAEDGSLEVRPELERDEHGELTYGPVQSLPAAYVRTQVELGYAATVHAVEGTTIGTASRPGSSHTVVSRTMGVAHAYVGLTRATGENHAWVELEGDETPVGRLAAVVSRDDHQPAARSEMAVEEDRATHLAHLGPQWESMVRETRAATHRAMLRSSLGDEADLVLRDRASSRLFGLIRGAELSGHEPGDLIASCAARGSLVGSRSPASVLYARMSEEMAAGGVSRPVPIGFEARTPRASRGDVENERLDHARALGKVMDRRAAYLGELAAVDQPAWAVRALGAVPADPGERAGWIGRAALAAAYRERYGIAEDTTVLGRRPAHAEPERGWLWDTAARLVGMPEHERNLAGLSDGDLANRVQEWQRAQAWAPRNVDRELREAHEARREADRQVVDARVRGADTVEVEADQLVMATRVDRLEEVAEGRTRWFTHTAAERERAEEAREEQRRRQEVEQARGGLHPDDPGAIEPDDIDAYDELDVPNVEGEKFGIPEPVDPHAAVLDRAARTWTPEAPPLFGSREWVELEDDDPRKRAGVTAAATRWWNFGERLDADRAEVAERLAREDVEEPEAWPAPEVSLSTRFWAEDHGLHVEGPEYGSPEWAELRDDDPGKDAAETWAAMVWLNDGDNLDDRRARAERAEAEARERAAVEDVKVAHDPHVAAMDQRAAELEAAAEPGGFARPVEAAEPDVASDPERVDEPEPAGRSRYSWVHDAANAEEQRRTVVEVEPEPVEVPEPREPEPEPVEEELTAWAQRDAALHAEVERARLAVERVEREEAAQREMDDAARQRDDERARDDREVEERELVDDY